MDLRQEFVFPSQILAIFHELGPFCLDLGNFAQIWAILLGFGLFGRIRVRIGPEGDKAQRMGQGRTDGRTDGQTNGQMDRRTNKQISSVFNTTSSPSEPLPCSLLT